MKTVSLLRVLLSWLDFPEGPVFDSPGRSLIRGTAGWEPGKEIGHRVTRFPTGGQPNGLAIDDRDMALKKFDLSGKWYDQRRQA